MDQDYVAFGSSDAINSSILKTRILASNRQPYSFVDGNILEDAYHEVVAKLESCEAQMALLNAQVEESEKQRVRLQNENQALRDRAADVEERLDELESLNSSVCSCKDKSVADRRAQDEVATLERSNQQLNADNQQLAAQLQLCEQQLQLVKQGRENALQQLSAALDRLHDVEAEREHLQKDIGRLQNFKTSLDSSYSKTIEELSGRIKQLQHNQQNADLNHNVSLSDANADFSHLIAENHNLRNEISRMNMEMRNGQDLLAAIRVARADSRDDLDIRVSTVSDDIGAFSVLSPVPGDAGPLSLADEIERLGSASKDQLLDKLEEAEHANQRLRAYVGELLMKIMERDPTILEVKAT